MDKGKLLYVCFLFTISISFLLLQCRDAATHPIQYFQIGTDNVSVEQIVMIPNAYNQCYVSVAVHNSSTYAYGLANATVTVLSRSKRSSSYKYTGFSQAKTDSTGRVCLIVYCREEGVIFVELNSVRIFAARKLDQQDHLPPSFKVDVIYNNEVIHFYTFAWGTILGHTGPVYNSRGECTKATMKDYHFVFSYISKADELVSTSSPIGSEFAIYSWNIEHTCYLKLLIMSESDLIRIKVYSYVDSPQGQLLGLYITSPIYDVSSNDSVSKTACLEFRCPIYDLNDIQQNTFIQGSITDGFGGPMKCCVKQSATNQDFKVNNNSFNSTFIVGNNYGPSDGVYTAVNKQQARSRCFTGRDFLGTEYAMNVHQGYAIEYDCTTNVHCSNPLSLDQLIG